MNRRTTGFRRAIRTASIPAFFAILLAAADARAEVVRVEVTDRRVAEEGAVPYEVLRGTLWRGSVRGEARVDRSARESQNEELGDYESPPLQTRRSPR